jgi:hypothetical protein
MVQPEQTARPTRDDRIDSMPDSLTSTGACCPTEERTGHPRFHHYIDANLSLRIAVHQYHSLHGTVRLYVDPILTVVPEYLDLNRHSSLSSLIGRFRRSMMAWNSFSKLY